MRGAEAEEACSRAREARGRGSSTGRLSCGTSPVVTAAASPVMRPCACVSHVLYCLGGRVGVLPGAHSCVVAVLGAQDIAHSICRAHKLFSLDDSQDKKT